MRVAAPSANENPHCPRVPGRKGDEGKTPPPFGSIEWALAKVARGFGRGCEPGSTDCHGRAGHALRLLGHLDVDEDPAANSSFVLLGLPSGRVAHSLVVFRGKPLASTRDRSVLAAIGQYRVLHEESVGSARAWLSDRTTSVPDDPFDRVTARVMEITRDPEIAVFLLERTLDEIVKAGASGSYPGLDRKDKVENALLEGLEQCGATRTLFHDGNVDRLELTDTGRELVALKWEREVALGRMTRERQLALLDSVGSDARSGPPAV